MAFIEAAPIAEEALGGEAAGGAGGLGGAKEFNDMPGGQIVGSMFGKVVHAVTGAIGTGGGEERVDEGPVGRLA